MKYPVLIAAFAAMLAMHASAAGYDDLSHGIDANLRDDSKAAIAAFTAALADADLNPAMIPNAHFGRAVAYLHEKRCAEAQADVDAATKLKPGYSDAIALRVQVDLCLNRPEKAVEDFEPLIEASPTRMALYSERGRVRWLAGDFLGAAADFEKVSQKDSYDAYAVLWLELARLRAGTLDITRAKRDVSDLNLMTWPEPLLNVVLGEDTVEEANAAAARGDEQTVKNQQCEANFYLAEWMIAQKDQAAAKPMLEQARDKCPKNFIEQPVAEGELANLK